ncbi:Uncharacterised protein [Mycobacteroides abscessus subsp. abscessus]|nr:Uncharacterised protein [Mycobacteroides abscessus subsp. abscessus]
MRNSLVRVSTDCAKLRGVTPATSNTSRTRSMSAAEVVSSHATDTVSASTLRRLIPAR